MNHEPELVSVNPATAETIRGWTLDTPAQVDQKLDKLNESYLAHKRDREDVRAQRLRDVADTLEKHRDALAAEITREMGKPIAQSRAEVDKSIQGCRHYAAKGASYLAPTALELGTRKNTIIYRPLGIILAVLPWNFPLWQAIRVIAPALALGNRVAIKHAPNTQGCAALLEQILANTGDALYKFCESTKR